MIKYAEFLHQAIERYNSTKPEEKHLDFWEVVDEIDDIDNDDIVWQTIIEIYMNI